MPRVRPAQPPKLLMKWDSSRLGLARNSAELHTSFVLHVSTTSASEQHFVNSRPTLA